MFVTKQTGNLLKYGNLVIPAEVLKNKYEFAKKEQNNK